MPYRTVGIQAVVDDAAPQLGGDLDVNGKKITSDDDIILVPDSRGALRASDEGDGRGIRAVDLQQDRSNDDEVASGNHATIGGGKDNKVSGDCATVGGGEGNEATQDHAGVGGGKTNKASDVFATVAGGLSNEATADYAAVAGGQVCKATANHSAVGGGNSNEASGLNGTIPGGYDCGVTAQDGKAQGRQAVARLQGEDAWSGVGNTYNVQRSWFQQHGEVVYNGGSPQEITAPERLVFEQGYTYWIRTRVLLAANPTAAVAATYETVVQYSAGGLAAVDGPTQIRSVGSGGSIEVSLDTSSHMALKVSAYASNSGDHCPVHVLHEILRVKNGYACGC